MSLTIRERAKNLFASNKTPENSTDSTMVQDKGNPELAAAVAESKEKLRRRGKTGYSSAGSESAQAATKTPEQIATELNALLQPKVWLPVVKAPASLMMTLTNHAHWDMEDKEVEPLAVTASTAMQYAAIRSPGLLAFSLFLIHATIVYGPRTIMELKIRREEKAIRDRQKAGMGDIKKDGT